MTQGGWEAVVNDMVSKGARGTDDEFDRVVNYLGQHFGPNSPMGKEPSRATSKPDVAPQAVPAAASRAGGGSEAARGKALVESNACLTCHRINNEGSRMGPDLSTIGSKRSAERLKTAIVAPDQEVLPENRLVDVVLNDGSTRERADSEPRCAQRATDRFERTTAFFPDFQNSWIHHPDQRPDARRIARCASTVTSL